MPSAIPLRIGPLRLLYAVAPPFPTPKPNALYASFLESASPDCDAVDPLLTLSLDITSGDTACPAEPPSFEAARHWKVYRERDDLLFFTGYGVDTHPERMCRVARDLSRATITVNSQALERRPIPARLAFPLAYPLDQILAWGLLSKIQGVLLHAAVVVRDDGAGYLFAGRSGAGKSTLSALCAASGWTILNDDRALVYIRDSQAFVSGTPWHGTGRYAVPRTVPLRGIFFLAQAKENRAEPLDRAALLQELLRVASLPLFEDQWATPVFATLNELTETVPTQRLHFTRDGSAVEYLRTYHHYA